MAKVLVLFAHPAFERSRVNADLLGAVQSVEGVAFRDLYELYPDFLIDVPREQKRLLRYDLIIFQHPFFWYSAPALVKEYIDLVFEHGWAYGKEGHALEGKTLLSVVTTGAGADDYGPDGPNRYSMREFLRPFEGTARLCGMRYAPPFVVHGALHLDPGVCDRHVEGYARVLEAARDDVIDWTTVTDKFETLYPHLPEILPKSLARDLPCQESA